MTGYDAAEITGLDDPYPAYARLRAEGRVLRAGPGAWAITRYHDIARLLVDPRCSHEFPDAVYRLSGEPDALTGFFRTAVLNRDPPGHTPVRRMMARAVMPRTVGAFRGRVERLAADLFDGMADGHADLVTDLAYPLPVTVAAELLGIPAPDRDQAQLHAVALGRMFGTGTPTERERADAVHAVGWLRGYVDDLVRRTDPADETVVAQLARAAAASMISHADLVDNIIFLFFAGFETTTNLLSTGCALLLQRPELLAQLRARPELAAGAVDEFLRYDGPIHSTARITREPVDVGDRVVRAGRVVVLLLASANRDDEQFACPDTLDIRRSPNPHLSFSAGPHHCLGATLARMEATVVFAHIASRLDTFELTGDVVRRTDLGFRGHRSIPVSVRPRRRRATG